MKIAIYKDSLAGNRGADVAVRNLSAGLAERGHEAVLFEKPELLSRLGERWDVLVSAGTNELLDLVAAGIPLPPIVQQFQTEPAYQFRHWLRRWRRNRAIKLALPRVAAIQVLLPSHEEWLRSNVAGLDGVVRMFVVGNWCGVSVPASSSCNAEHLVICPGAINRDKNQGLLVRAFCLLSGEFPDWSLELYGKGRSRDEAALRRLLESSAVRSGGRDPVRLMGFCNLVEAYSKCAFVAFPSKTEGFPLAVIEAATFAKPAVMIRDWIGTAAVDGGIVAEPTVSAYAAALRRLMSDPDLCRRMGESARRYCDDCYSRAKILDQWEALLGSVVAGREKCP